jgi:hypothetical protein
MLESASALGKLETDYPGIYVRLQSREYQGALVEEK